MSLYVSVCLCISLYVQDIINFSVFLLKSLNITFYWKASSAISIRYFGLHLNNAWFCEADLCKFYIFRPYLDLILQIPPQYTLNCQKGLPKETFHICPTTSQKCVTSYNLLGRPQIIDRELINHNISSLLSFDHIFPTRIALCGLVNNIS